MTSRFEPQPDELTEAQMARAYAQDRDAATTLDSRLARGSSPGNPSASTDERVELRPDYPGGSS